MRGNRTLNIPRSKSTTQTLKRSLFGLLLAYSGFLMAVTMLVILTRLSD